MELGNRKMVLLVEGADNPTRAKTAINLLRYCPEEVVAVLDPPNAGRSTGSVLRVESDRPVISSLDQAVGATSVVVGLAPAGGGLPRALRAPVEEALRLGWTVYSGMHEFLSEDSFLYELALKSGGEIVDLRKNHERSVASDKDLRSDQLRVLTVGQDCSVGKMVVSLELARALSSQPNPKQQQAGESLKAAFAATGQTGMLIAGEGVPMDAVVGDFLNGAAENLVRRYEGSDIVMIEGQGSVFHPRYSPVTLGLLHGSRPDALIYCLEAGRVLFGGMKTPLPSTEMMIRAYESFAMPGKKTPVIGIAVNTRNLDAPAAEKEIADLEELTGLPVTDVIRYGTEKLIPPILNAWHEKTLNAAD